MANFATAKAESGFEVRENFFEAIRIHGRAIEQERCEGAENVTRFRAGEDGVCGRRGGDGASVVGEDEGEEVSEGFARGGMRGEERGGTREPVKKRIGGVLRDRLKRLSHGEPSTFEKDVRDIGSGPNGGESGWSRVGH